MNIWSKCIKSYSLPNNYVFSIVSYHQYIDLGKRKNGAVAILATRKSVLSLGKRALRALLPSVRASTGDPKISLIAYPDAGALLNTLKKPDEALGVVLNTCVVSATTPLGILWLTIQHTRSNSISDVEVRGVLLYTGPNIKRQQQEMRLIFKPVTVQPKGLNVNFCFT